MAKKKAQLPAPVPSLLRVGTAYGLASPMASLFEKHDVAFGDYEHLAWELAGKYEKGFRASKGGRPREIPAWLFEELVTFFARHYRSGRSLRSLAAQIKRDCPDTAPPIETLRKHLARALAVAQQKRREQERLPMRTRLARALASG